MGNQGLAGDTGPQEPSFAQAIIDGVTILPPYDTATVSAYFDGSNVRFSFGIPQGVPGEPAPPGGVTEAQLDAAISGTSSNSHAVSTMGLVASDPPNARRDAISGGQVG